MHPAALLTALAAIACAIAAWCSSLHERSLAAADAEVLRERLRDGRPGDPTGTSNNVLETNAALLQQVNGLQAKQKELEAENRDLRDRLAQALEAAKPPPAPDDLQMRLVTERQLAFQKKPLWVPVSVDDIVERITKRTMEAIPESQNQSRSRGYRALGLADREFDYRRAMAELASQKSAGCYEAETGKFYFQGDASLARSDARTDFIGALVPALLAQNFPHAAKQWLAADNDDAALAALSLIHGDANFTRVRFSISDQAAANFDKGQPIAAPPRQPNAPFFLSESWKFTETAGQVFVESLHANGGPPAINRAYHRPPRSTAEVLHPDKLYLATPPFAPVEVAVPDPSINGAAPLFTNVAGELGVFHLLHFHADMEYCTAAAEGWAGDRYWVYGGDESRGDHLAWRSVWLTPDDAGQFFDALRRILMQRYSIPWQAEFDAQPGRFAVTEPRRIIRLVKADKSVTLIDATDAAFAHAMETRFL